MTVHEGDVVQIDLSLEYGNVFTRRYKAVVLWNGFNGQPLFTEVGKYKPHWGTYGEIESVIGHIDLEQAVKWE